MARYRLYPTPEQEAALLEHCAHARYVWNLAVEQRSWWQPGRRSPGYAEQSRQLTEARTASPWLAAGSHMVQQQALRDFQAAWTVWFGALREWREACAKLPPERRPEPPGQPGFRKRGVNEGFWIVGRPAGRVEQINRRWSRVLVPKIGYVKFRRSRSVPEAKSYRVTKDRSGCWHIAFAAIPELIPAPGNGQAVGVDRGVAVSAALSTGELLRAPELRPAEQRRLRLLERSMNRQRKSSCRRARTKRAIARLRAREAARRRDWVEKISTDLARRFDLIAVENLDVRAMTRSAKGTVERPGRNVRQKAGLNRGIRANGWGRLAKRLEDKAPGRVVVVPAHYTSQRCSACGHVAAASRESQARYRCVACEYTDNADVNAAKNILAAGQGGCCAGRLGSARADKPRTSSCGLCGCVGGYRALKGVVDVNEASVLRGVLRRLARGES
jgi:putative transposase